MDIRRRWGKSIDRESWSSLMSESAAGLQHDLWCAVIRTIAGNSISPKKESQFDDEQDLHESIEEVIHDWLLSTLPSHTDLAWIIGEFDYFTDMGLGWDEVINLSGDACGDVEAVRFDLLNYYSKFDDEITEESIDTFYSAWRSSFLELVSVQAAKHGRS